MKSFLTFLGAVLLACAAHADSLQTLDTFLKDVSSGRASFTQVVTSPQRSGEARPRTRTSIGRFEFLRPDRFRFEYARPFPQTIVADGQTLWLHDVDLNQVTARGQKEVLGSTPAALIASSADIKALQNDFNLADAADQDGLQWVLGSPKAKDNQLQSVRVGFRQNQLEKLEIVDTFGQKSVITFSGFQTNAVINPELFQFKPPAGADVVRQ